MKRFCNPGVTGMALAVLASAWLAGCSCGDGGGKTAWKGDVPTKDPFGFDVSNVKIDLPEIAVVTEADKTFGVAGDEFTVKARIVAGPTSGITWTWNVPSGGNIVEGGSKNDDFVTIEFDKTGEFDVDVVVADKSGNKADSGVVLLVAEPGSIHQIGDIDGNGLDQGDVDALTGYLGGDVSLREKIEDAADVDRDGDIDQEDLALLQDAVTKGEAGPTYISRTKGSALTAVMVVHPSLLDPSKDVKVALKTKSRGKWDQSCLDAMKGKPHFDDVVFNRSDPGYLAFSIPVKYACLTGPETVEVALEAGGESHSVADSFVIEPLPPASDEPGSNIIQVMGRLRMALEAMSEVTASYSDLLGASKEEKALLQGTMTAVSDMYDEEYGKFFVAFHTLDDRTKAMWERLAVSQGMDQDMVQALEEQTTKILNLAKAIRTGSGTAPKAMDPNVTDALLSLICAFNKIADISEKVADINDKISSALKYLDWFPLNRAPVIGGAISFLSNLSDIISMLTGLMDMVSKFVPEPGDKIDVKASPAALALGQEAVISASIELKISTKLCNQAAEGSTDSLTDMLSDYLTKQLASRIPYAGSYFKKKNYDPDDMNWIMEKLFSAIQWLAGTLLDMTGINDYLKSLAEKFCDLLKDPNLPVNTDILEPSCGKLSDDSKWTCSEGCSGYPEPNEVGFSGSKAVCGEDKPAAGGLTCLGEPPAVCGNGELEEGEQCEKDNPCEEPKVCNPDCQCVDKDVCGNGILEQGEECEKDADCKQGWICGPTDCRCWEDFCTKDEDCKDDDPNDCKVYKCDTKTGKCEPANAAYQQACDTDPCMLDQACDVDGQCKFGTPKECKDFPGAETCYDAACDAKTGECTYNLKQGAECGKDGDCVGGRTCNTGTCKCEGSGVTECGATCDENYNCTPDPPGTKYIPISGCDDWTDADQASGWHSVVEASGNDPEGKYPDGTRFTGYGCTIEIDCP